MTAKPIDPTKDPNEEERLAVQAKLEAAIAAHSPKGADTQRAEASHPKPSEQTSEPSDPNLRSHPNLSRLIEAAEYMLKAWKTGRYEPQQVAINNLENTLQEIRSEP